MPAWVKVKALFTSCHVFSGACSSDGELVHNKCVHQPVVSSPVLKCKVLSDRKKFTRTSIMAAFPTEQAEICR